MTFRGDIRVAGGLGFVVGFITAVAVTQVARTGRASSSGSAASEPVSAAETRAPVPAVLSLRKSAPYVVTTDVLAPAQLREMLGKSGARVLNCFSASKALVEANEAVLKAMAADARYYKAEALSAEAKVQPDVPTGPASGRAAVRLLPMSSLDVGEIVKAVVTAGGEATGAFAPSGRPFVNASVPADRILDLARRGDVLRIERGE